MESVYSMAFYFVEKCINDNLYNGNDIEAFHDNIIEELKRVSDLGWQSETIMKYIANMKNVSLPDMSKLTLLFPTPKYTENLLNSSEFYYHNLLRITPGIPVQEWNINTGEFSTLSEEYYLEMRSSLTTKQLLTYYCERFDINEADISVSRYEGSLKYLIKKFGIDLLLFAIDTASDNILSEDYRKPSTPVEVGEYVDEARNRLMQKISENKTSGDDQIVTKQRVLPSRNRTQKQQGDILSEFDNYS